MMKNKKLTSKILLAVLLAAPYGVSEAATPVAGKNTNFNHNKNNYENADSINVQVSYKGEQSNTTIMQTTVSTSAKSDVIVKYLGKEIYLDFDNFESGNRNKKFHGLYTYANTSKAINYKPITYLGGEYTDVIYIDGDGHDLISGITIQGSTKNNGPEVIVMAKDFMIATHSTNYYAYGVNVGNNTTELNGKTPAKLIINAENTVINTTADVKIDETDGDNHAIAMSVLSQGELEINGNLEVNADTVLSTRGKAVTKINAANDTSKIIKLNGDINFNYSNTTSVEADVTINLANEDSYLDGNILVNGKNIPEGFDNVSAMKLGLSNNAQWTTDEDSFVNELTMDGGIINLSGEEQTLKVDSLTGSGGAVNVGSSNSTMAITSKDVATALTVTATRDYSSQLAKQNVEDAFEQVAKQVYIAGESEADNKTAATKVAMEETDVRGYTSVDVDENGNFIWDTLYKAPNTTNEKISNMAGLAYMAWRAENNDMNKRLGELRDSKGEHGIWARMVRGESDYRSIDYQYNTYQLGYDEKLSTNSNWTVGGAVTYTDGVAGIGVGSAETKHTGFALYGSYLNDDGSFIDLIAKYARLEHDFDVTASTGAGSGGYDTNGYSVSAEYGKRFTQDNGFWIEPQVELTYGKIGSADFVTEKGVKVRQDGMDSLVGRLGFAMGKNFKQGNAYVRASYLYDFEGETSTTFTNGVDTGVFEDDLGGGWWEVGVGTNINLSDATHLYFDVEKTYGGDVATPWQWNLGVRYSF